VVTGDVRIHHGFPSRALGNRRDVRVYLPPGYEQNPDRHYPVLYVQDGQNVFDGATAAFGVEWGLDETAERLIRSGELPPMIIVAADNTPERLAEYSPVPDPEHGGGKAEAYGAFLVDELKPFVDQRYRTLKDREHTGVMGSSMGGLVSLYLGFKHPGVFGLVGALSPSLWWADHLASQQLAGSGPSRIWLDAGTREGQDADQNGVSDMIDDTRELAHRLIDTGWTKENFLFYREVQGGTHSEASWAERAGDVLTALYGERP
jgi:predicted alpha/beta superfamily hydrolase